MLNKSITPWSSKTKARKPIGSGTPISRPNTRTRSKETVINSPWIKTETNTTACASFLTEQGEWNQNNSEEATSTSETVAETANNQDMTAGQNVVRTRAQKRKMSFKENREVEVSLLL